MSILKEILNIRYYQQYIKPYIQRIKQDGGVWKSETNTQLFYKMCKDYNIVDSIKFAWLGEAGGKLRTSGANQFWTKAYSLVTPQAKYGSELITNQADREFTSDTGWWSKEQPATIIISDGVCHFTNTTSNFSIYRGTFLTIGKYYKVSFTVKNYVTGQIKANNNSVGFTSSGNGAYQGIVFAVNQNLYFSAVGTTTLDIDNISVVEVLNSLDGSPTDATQTTSTSQPYIAGNIAPTERLGMKNPNGGSNYMTHPTISFAANEAWSVTTVVNANGKNEAQDICGTYNKSVVRITLANNLQLISSTTALSLSSAKISNLYGKNSIITIVAKGDGSVSFYVNGQLLQNFASLTNRTIFDFTEILRGRDGNNTIFTGSIPAHIIRSQALTTSQVAAEANFLRSLYPEIPSVTIGSQVWATSNCDMAATPMGNLIANVTADANVEKITNGGFDADTNWIKGIGWTISGGVAVATNATGELFQDILSLSSGWKKITFTVSNFVSGDFQLRVGGINQGYYSSNGTYTKYVQVSTTSVRLAFSGNTSYNATIDNVSFEEIGWAGSTELYNGIYAQTSGTVEQKTYAAVKAAAMWRYPSNDVALGAIYNKKYNKYALKLISMDIGYYNTANPTALWGYHVPTRAELTTLSLQGGNVCKKDGTIYWNTANGTNSNGFTALGGGYIAADGTTTNLKSSDYFGCSDADFAREIKDADNTFNEVAITTHGVSLRLVKD